MNIIRVLLIFAALVLAFLSGMVSMAKAIRRYFPKTTRALAVELNEKQAARAAAQERGREL